MQSRHPPDSKHMHTGLARLASIALCGTFLLGAPNAQAYALSYNQLGIIKGIGGDLAPDHLENSGGEKQDIKSFSASFEYGERRFFELALTTGESNVITGAVGLFGANVNGFSTYAAAGPVLVTTGTNNLSFAASFGARKLLTPYIELSPSVSISFNFGYNEAPKSVYSLALRLYPTSTFSIDILGISSEDVSGTMLGISHHF